MTAIRKRVNDLRADLEAKHGLDWPLTFRGQDPVFILARQMLTDAEAYLRDGQEVAAALSVRVTEDCLRVLASLHALATEDI